MVPPPSARPARALVALILLLPTLVLLPGAAQAYTVSVMGGALPTPSGYGSVVWDGAHAYVFGGYTGSASLDKIWRYNPSTDTLTVMGATLPSARYGSSAIWDGTNAYVFGGSDGASSFGSIVRYNPTTSTVTTMSATLPTGRFGTAAVWDGTNAYVFGGRGCTPTCATWDQIVRYNPTTNTVAVMSAKLPTARYWLSAVWDGSNAYVFGGTDGTSLNQIVRYNPATNTVTTMSATLPSGRYVTSASWDGAYAYVFSGTTGSSKPNEIVRYDPAANVASILSATLPAGREGTMATYDGSSSYVLGGAQNCCPVYTSQILRVSPIDPPSAPQSLTATPGPGAGKITLTWQVPSSNGGSPVTGYRVYRGTTSGSEALVTTGGCSGLGNVLTCVDAGLPDGALRHYKVSAINAAGEGPRSSEASASTLPGAPQGLAVVSGPGAGELTLSWQAPAGENSAPITQYKVYRGLASGSGTLVTSGGCSALGNALTCTDSGLGNGATRYYKVSAVNAAGEGPQGNEASATTAEPPSAPQDLVAAPGPNGGEITLTWQAPSDDGGLPVTSYRVYRGLISGGETPVASGGCHNLGNVLTCVDSGLGDGATRYYRVSAVNAAGEGPQGNEASATTLSPPGAPLALTALPGGVGTILLNWQPPANDGGSPVTSYRVHRGVTSGGETLLATLGNVLSYTDASCVPLKWNYYYVTAANAAGQGPPSSEAVAFCT